MPSILLGGLDGDEPAREAIIEQDRVIAEKSGKPSLAITSIVRSGKPAVEKAGKDKSGRKG